MAEETTQDQGQKTEQPSQKRLTDAYSAGQGPLSREVNALFAIGALTAGVLLLGPATWRLALLLRGFFEFQPYMTGGEIDWGAVRGFLLQTGILVLPILGLALAASLAAPFIQTGFVWAPERVMPDLEHVSPAAGVKRIFSARNLVEFLKTLVKVFIISAAAAWALAPEMGRLNLLIGMAAGRLLEEMRDEMLKLLFAGFVVAGVIALFDYGWQRFSFIRSLRMSREDLKQEMKETEGDPIIRARLRAIRMSRAKKRMMAAVKTASVVITNPTHYAVALKYDIDAPGAPVVVAKGQDFVALRIREEALKHEIPIVENPPVARMIHAKVDIDAAIPEDMYKAVAEIISYVLRLKGKLKPKAKAAAGAARPKDRRTP